MKNLTSAFALTLAALATGGAAQAASVTFDSAAFGQLPDDDPAGITRGIDVSANGIVTDVNLTLTGSTSYIGDLVVTLTSASGTVVDLLCRVGKTDCGAAGGFGDASNLAGSYTFDDEADVNIAAAAAGVPGGQTIAPGSYSTANSTGRNGGLLSIFDGEEAFGLWSLTISDNAFVDIAQFDAASLSLDIAPEVSPIPLPATLPLMVLGLGALGFAGRRKG